MLEIPFEFPCEWQSTRHPPPLSCPNGVCTLFLTNNVSRKSSYATLYHRRCCNNMPHTRTHTTIRPPLPRMHQQFRRNSSENANDVHQHDNNNADCENSLREFIETICFDLAAQTKCSNAVVQHSTVKTLCATPNTFTLFEAHTKAAPAFEWKSFLNLIFQLMLLLRMRQSNRVWKKRMNDWVHARYSDTTVSNFDRKREKLR